MFISAISGIFFSFIFPSKSLKRRYLYIQEGSIFPYVLFSVNITKFIIRNGFFFLFSLVTDTAHACAIRLMWRLQNEYYKSVI